MTRTQIVFPLLKTVCKELNVEFIEEPSRGMFGVMIFENGKKFFVKDVNFNLNYTSSVRITKNKALTSYFLELFGYRIPRYTMVYPKRFSEKNRFRDTLENAAEFIGETGYPLILKINDSSQGRGIYKADNYGEFQTAVAELLSCGKAFQIQKYYGYNDYRVVILGGEVLSAYQRIPLNVVGDGKNSVSRLLQIKQDEFISRGRDTVINVDSEITTMLAKQGCGLDTVLESGTRIRLKNVSNLSAGGECVELTDKIHKDYADLCVRIANDFNMNLCGIDIMCRDLCKSADDYVILELNSSPGLDNYAFGKSRQEQYVKELYTKVVLFIKNNLCV